MAIRYHICLVCNGTGKKDNKPCEMCARRWNSKRLETIYDLTKSCESSEPIPMDPRGFLMFAGFDKGIGESNEHMPIGLVFEEFRVRDGKVILEEAPEENPPKGKPIEIEKSATADSRTCDVSLVDKETLLSSSKQHIDDVKKAMAFICERLMQKANNHDYDKLDGIDHFYSDFKTKFESHGWFDNHKKIQRHHLDKDCEEYSQIDLLDVLENIVDSCMAGLARSGSVYPLKISPEILQQAVQNTADLLVKNTEVKD